MKKKLSMVIVAAMLVSCLTMSVSAADWTIASDTVFRPFEYTDENGDFVGIDVDLLAAIAEDQGFDYELNSLGWDSAIAACQAGQADGMIAGASITDERKDSGWIFSDGYYNATQSMTVPTDSDITGFDDLDGQTVGVKTGTQGATYAESLADEYGFSITYYEDSPTMYQAVTGGQVVACFEDTPIMVDSIQDGNLDLQVLYDTESEGSPYGFAIFDEDNQDLIDLFNAGLYDIVVDGTYQDIIAKYLGDDAAESAQEAMEEYYGLGETSTETSTSSSTEAATEDAAGQEGASEGEEIRNEMLSEAESEGYDASEAETVVDSELASEFEEMSEILSTETE